MSLLDVDLLARAQRAVDELVPEGVRVEVLDGMLVMNPPASLAHGELTARIAAILANRAPTELSVNATGIGIHRTLDPLADYQVPDVVVYHRPSNADRLVGSDIELVVEVVSPANRRQARYEDAVIARATAYGIPWVFVVDPEVRTARWWHQSAEQPTGPQWSADLGAQSVWHD